MLRKQYREFRKSKSLKSDHDFVQAGLVWGTVDGNVTPSILLIALEPGHWEHSKESSLEMLAGTLLADIVDYPVFAHLQNDTNSRCYSLFRKDGTHSVDKIPSLGLIRDYERLEEEASFRWSMRIYTRLMYKLDAFHEQVYQTVKDRISDKNDIIEEVSKILFLETFRVHHDEDLTFKCKRRKLRFQKVFDFRYVKQHGAKAVEEIQAAFEAFKSHDNYVVTADDGTENPIFDKNAHLRLEQPENYETLLEAIQDLGPVTDNQGRVIKDQGTLADVSADLLGRVFDVFLRANFESKGGLGVYLTPNPVKQAMLQMAFHDIGQDNKAMENLTAGNFHFCDPACGTYGFGSVALNHLEGIIDRLTGMNDTQKENLKQKLRNNSFVGADSAPRMVMLARVNMALQNAPNAKIFYTDNSLTTTALKPNSFDLICTNPPFGTPKFKKDKKGQTAKKQYEERMEPILESFRADLRDVSTAKKAKRHLYPSASGLAMGSSPNNKGEWTPVKGTSIDPAVLFIDRCLQLLKPGGRLLIVLPDGVLCNSSDRYVREYIMGKKDKQSGEFMGGKAIVKAVISLPADTFKLSGTGAKTSVLYVQKRKANKDDPEQFLAEPQTDVFMGVADTLGYLVKNNVEDYSSGVPNDLDTIVGAYKRGE